MGNVSQKSAVGWNLGQTVHKFACQTVSRWPGGAMSCCAESASTAPKRESLGQTVQRIAGQIARRAADAVRRWVAAWQLRLSGDKNEHHQENQRVGQDHGGRLCGCSACR